MGVAHCKASGGRGPGTRVQTGGHEKGHCELQPQRMLWLPVITTVRGQGHRGQEVILVQDTQIRQSKQAWLSFLADHQSPSPTEVARVPGTCLGLQLVTWPQQSSRLPRTHHPCCWTWEDPGGASGIELGGPGGLRGQETKGGRGQPAQPAHFITGSTNGLRNLWVPVQATRRGLRARWSQTMTTGGDGDLGAAAVSWVPGPLVTGGQGGPLSPTKV